MFPTRRRPPPPFAEPSQSLPWLRAALLFLLLRRRRRGGRSGGEDGTDLDRRRRQHHHVRQVRRRRRWHVWGMLPGLLFREVQARRHQQRHGAPTPAINSVLSMIDDESMRREREGIALENGYTKIMMWSYASGIARHVLSATVKGQLYSLPADVHLKMQQLLDRLCSGINSLVASFDSRLRKRTLLVRTPF
ncbi:hypothetical protein HU200_003491 [Digitaria exilis]|uniref:Uncharacterized protein n=1 Tax=Digitaria exilis TaxID=1010633 RepID=A0A835KTC9_9POAL|nr:hypothetical protein HU200_003491 [Digitaria exilis]